MKHPPTKKAREASREFARLHAEARRSGGALTVGVNHGQVCEIQSIGPAGRCERVPIVGVTEEEFGRAREHHRRHAMRRMTSVARTVARTAPRQRGSGRPAARRSNVVKSGADPGDSADPEPPRPHGAVYAFACLSPADRGEVVA